MNNLQSEIRSLSGRLKLILWMLLILSIGLIMSTGVLAKKVHDLNNPSAVTKAEVAKTVLEVGKVIVLPTDEMPTLATVADPSKLAGQPFFASAMKGDVVLIYSISKKAILWRPSTKQVVEVSALNPGTSASGQ
jgi:hypothetical protein